MLKPQLGLALPQYGIDVEGGGGLWQAMRATAGAAEKAGLDAVWLSDHPFAVGPDGVESGAAEPLVSAAALLRDVPRVRVGTLVLSATMRSPALTAHVARSLNEGGRFVAGMGAGWYEPEHHAFGLRLPTYEERIDRLVASVDVLDALGDDRPRILCGGSGAAVLELAARRADAWNLAWDVPVVTFATLNVRLDDACDRAGRDPRTLARTVGLTVLVAEDERELDRAVERLRGRAAFLRDLDRRALAQRIVCGAPAECAERIAGYDADEVIVALLLRDDLEMVRLFGERVAPLLRSG